MKIQVFGSETELNTVLTCRTIPSMSTLIFPLRLASALIKRSAHTVGSMNLCGRHLSVQSLANNLFCSIY